MESKIYDYTTLYLSNVCSTKRVLLIAVVLCLQAPILYLSFTSVFSRRTPNYLLNKFWIVSHNEIPSSNMTAVLRHNSNEVSGATTLSTFIKLKPIVSTGTIIKTGSKDTPRIETSTLYVELPQCPKSPPGLQGNLSISFAKPPHTLNKIQGDNPLVLPGGYFKPKFCNASSKVAIVIPFRDRDEHLRYFLQYMHPTLQRQQLEYRVYVINQKQNGTFNRAKLMNVGYVESQQDLNFGCFVFHDVDLILENDYALYSCPKSPCHLSSAVDKFNYNPETAQFGGVTVLTKKQYELVNGYPNSYWGWGGEDEDMFQRVRNKHMKVFTYPVSISRYRMITHERDKGNEANPQRFDLIKKTQKTMQNDGLNNLDYDVISKEINPLYTNITVDIHPPT